MSKKLSTAGDFSSLNFAMEFISPFKLKPPESFSNSYKNIDVEWLESGLPVYAVPFHVTSP